MPLRNSAASLAFCFCGSVGAVQCVEEPSTLAETCVDLSSVRQNGEIRSSPIYRGGPNAIRRTSYVMVVNCAKGITTLQDADGVNFAGNLSTSTSVSDSLYSLICNATKTKTSKHLRQF